MTQDLARRRSRSLKTVLLGGAGVAAMFVVSACDDGGDMQAQAFRTVQDCFESGAYPMEFCEQNFDRAKEMNAELAPRYQSQADCEVDYGPGECGWRETGNAGAGVAAQEPQQAQSGGGWFSPLMMGFLIGNMMSGPNRYAASPLYRSSDGMSRTLSGSAIPPSTFGRGGARINSGVMRAPRSPSTFARGNSVTSMRGGFGPTGRGYMAGG